MELNFIVCAKLAATYTGTAEERCTAADALHATLRDHLLRLGQKGKWETLLGEATSAVGELGDLKARSTALHQELVHSGRSLLSVVPADVFNVLQSFTQM